MGERCVNWSKGHLGRMFAPSCKIEAAGVVSTGALVTTIHLLTLPEKSQPPYTFCNFQIDTKTTTVEQFDGMAKKACTEVTLPEGNAGALLKAIIAGDKGSILFNSTGNIVKGLRKFKLTGAPDQLVADALTVAPSLEASE